MTHSHIASAFDQDLDRLTESLGAMGDFAGGQFADAVAALLQGDTDLARRVVEQDRQLDALRRDLSASAALVIAKRQPMAGDLEEVLVDFRIVEDLERIGDLAKNIAKRAIAVSGSTLPADLAQRMEEMAALAVELLRRAVATFVAGDADEALVVRSQDESIDQLHTTLFRDLVARMGMEPSQALAYVHLLFCAKNIERVGDHAAHVAEAAYVKATGKQPDTERRRLDESSSVTGHTQAGSLDESA